MSSPSITQGSKPKRFRRKLTRPSRIFTFQAQSSDVMKPKRNMFPEKRRNLFSKFRLPCQENLQEFHLRNLRKSETSPTGRALKRVLSRNLRRR